METLEQRVASLERSNRRWRYGAALLVLLSAGLAAANRDDDVAAVTRTRKLEIVNEQNDVLAELSANEAGPAFYMKTPEGEPIITMRGIAMHGIGPIGELSVKDPAYRTSIDGRSITISRDPAPDLSNRPVLPDVISASELPPEWWEYVRRGIRVSLGAVDGPSDEGYVRVLNSRGKIAAEMKSTQANAGLIMANDSRGNPKQSLSGIPRKP